MKLQPHLNTNMSFLHLLSFRSVSTSNFTPEDVTPADVNSYPFLDESVEKTNKITMYHIYGRKDPAYVNYNADKTIQ